MKKAYRKFLQETIARVKRPWFPFLLAALAFLDHFILIVPIDGLLCLSVLLNPALWKRKGVATTIGSTLGAFTLAVLIRIYGLDAFQSFFPHVVASQSWSWSMEVIAKWGVLGLFFMMASPFMQQPAICLVGVGDTSLAVIFITILAGKGVKYAAFSSVASRFPHFLHKFKFISSELDEIGTVIEQENKT